MTDATRFAYAGTRMQSRFATRPGEPTWAHLARIDEFGQLLQAVRASPLAPWAETLAPESGPHQIERGLRAHYREQVREVADWLPRRWQAAMEWLAWLPFLFAVAHQREGRPAQPWMQSDPVLAALAAAGGARVDREIEPLRKLAAAADDGRPIHVHWFEGWLERRPGRRDRSLATLDRHVAELLRPGAATGEQNPADHALHRMFRQHTRTATGAFAYVLLRYRELVRLRGRLLQVRLFGRAG